MSAKWIAAGLLVARAGVSLVWGLGLVAGHEKAPCCNARMCARPAATSQAAPASHCHESAPTSEAKLKCNCQQGEQAPLVVSSRPYVVEAAAVAAPAPAYAALAPAAVQRTRTGFDRLDSPPPRAV